MTLHDCNFFMADSWPLTITTDRYAGCYSHGLYHAWPLEANELPDGYDASDIECAEFWESYREPVGIGGSPIGAWEDLRQKVEAYRIKLQEKE